MPLACVTRAFDSTSLGVKRIEYTALDGTDCLQRTLHSMSSNKYLLLPQLREFGDLGRSVIQDQETTFYGVKNPRS